MTCGAVISDFGDIVEAHLQPWPAFLHSTDHHPGCCYGGGGGLNGIYGYGTYLCFEQRKGFVSILLHCLLMDIRIISVDLRNWNEQGRIPSSPEQICEKRMDNEETQQTSSMSSLLREPQHQVTAISTTTV